VSIVPDVAIHPDCWLSHGVMFAAHKGFENVSWTSLIEGHPCYTPGKVSTSINVSHHSAASVRLDIWSRGACCASLVGANAGESLQIDTFAHNKSGVAYQEG
jgi:hypothetical protein